MNLAGLHPPAVKLIAVLPYVELLVFGILILLLAALSRGRHFRLMQWLMVAGLAAAACSAVTLWGEGRVLFDQSRMIIMDNTAVYVLLLLCLVALVTGLMSSSLVTRHERLRGEFFALILLGVLGMGILASTLDLLVMFLAVELLSLVLYILAGFERDRMLSNEAALKYFILGSFSSGFFLLGIALLFGASNGTTTIGPMLSPQPSLYFAPEAFPWSRLPLSSMGWALVLIGIAFKIALVPFHVWTPDVYQGSPTPVTAFMSVGVKAAAFVALLRIAVATELFALAEWSTILAVLAVLTMTFGNLVALAQQSVKRMLAYSSIAHAGYLALGIVASGSSAMTNRFIGYQAMLFYLVAYAFMNLGAFAFVVFAGVDGSDLSLERCKGLGFRRPLCAAAMTVCLLSLAGIPPTMGFLAKLYLFQTVVAAGETTLAVIAVLNSVVAAYYYLRVIVMLYMHEPSTDEGTDPSLGLQIALCGCALMTLVFGLFPSAIVRVVQMCS